jgi:effector-binding domain-containing protein
MKSNQKHIREIRFEGDMIIIRGEKKSIKTAISDISKKLMQANSIERNTYQISPSGLGVHWPLIDEDLSFPNL